MFLTLAIGRSKAYIYSEPSNILLDLQRFFSHQDSGVTVFGLQQLEEINLGLNFGCTTYLF